MHAFGLSEETRVPIEKPTQVQGEHANPAQKSPPLAQPGFKPGEAKALISTQLVST